MRISKKCCNFARILQNALYKIQFINIINIINKNLLIMKKIFTFLMVALFSATMFADTDTWTVAGSNTAVFGTSWDPANTANDMVLVDGLYQFVKEDVAVAKGSIGFKVCKNHAWGEAYPSSDYLLNIAEDGAYDITITFNESTKEITAVAEKKGSAEIEKHYLVAGQKEIANGEDWNNDADVNLMITEDEGLTYTLTIEDVTLVASTNYSYQIVEKGTWNKYVENGSISVEETAIYTLKYVYTVATGTCAVQTTKTGEVVVVEAYYLVGSEKGWNPAEANKFEANPSQEGEYSLLTTLVENETIKVVKTVNGSITTWYPDGMGTDYKVDADHAGDKTIYFRPAGNSEWESFHTGGFFYIEPNTTTAIDNTAVEGKAVKSLENGMMIIEKNGVRYTVLGQAIK